MIWLAVGLVLCVTSPVVQGATTAFEWCYHDASCNDATWPIKAPQYCNGSRQSPVDIVSENATLDTKLTPFTSQTLTTSHSSARSRTPDKQRTVSPALGQQLLHPGSEHRVDGKRYPMEFHIVNLKSIYNLNTTQATQDSSGAAALGFFIDVLDNTTGEPAAWKTLTSYLSNITLKGQYYRYLGSLTTPVCYEIVVWTLFKEPVKISKDLIDKLSNTLRIGNTSSSEYMTNVYRNIQPDQPVTHSSTSKMNFSYGLFVFILALWMR
ncbi:hypothetical protein WMY93_010955 [Mugilogobius chulae]|uniref:Alpha-carbonic anhydrase domain-containing protein n=1 Tax=Mugilogobius chulae TaxID=88201 RepID=A0AAW0PC70_9GOBI